MQSIITKPTQFMDRTKPFLLDHIWLNSPTLYSSGIIIRDVTDHLPTHVRIPRVDKTFKNSDKIRISFRPEKLNNRNLV